MTRPTVIVAPNQVEETFDRPSVFLGGGITDCADWQAEMPTLFAEFPGVLLNPRRAVWPTDSNELERQIAWEQRCLRQADLRLFWFSRETVCPITLFELGYSLGAAESVVVGADPEYSRLDDIRIQLKRLRPGTRICHSLGELALEAQAFFTNGAVL